MSLSQIPEFTTVPSIVCTPERDAEFKALCEVIQPYTSLSVEYLRGLFEEACRLCQENVLGNFVECGSTGGGSCALLAYVIRRYSTTPRNVWCLDTFSQFAPAVPNVVGASSTTLQGLQDVCAKLGVADLVRPVNGPVEHTIQSARDWLGMIALLHISDNRPGSTRCVLDGTHGRISDRGTYVITNFGSSQCCREELQAFHAAQCVTPVMTRLDDNCVTFEKPLCFEVNPSVPQAVVDKFCEDDVITFGIESQMCQNERFQLYYALRSLVNVTPSQSEITFVEVGSYAGASLLQSYMALRSHGLPVKAYAVEPGGRPQFYDVLKGLGSDVTHLKMYSDKAAEVLSREMIGRGCYADVIFIDGDHTYEGVKRDIELYFPLLKPNGLILFHDYLPPLTPQNRDFILCHHANTEPGIRQACDEYFNRNSNAEAVELPLLKPNDPTQTQAYLPIIPGVFSTVRAWRKRMS